MRNARSGTLTAAVCLLGVAAILHDAAAAESLAPISQSLGYTEDKQGIRLTYATADADTSVTANKAGELLTQALGEFARQFPHYDGDLAFTIAALPNRQTALTVHPWSSGESDAAPRSDAATTSAGKFPKMPGAPPAHPDAPSGVSDVAYRRYANGYQRDTQYHRCLTCAPNGSPGPWRMVSDHLNYIAADGGGGSAAIGGGKLQKRVVIVHPPE